MGDVETTAVTQENLQAAFAGESMANRSYLAFAQKAEEEGLAAVAKRFRVAAESETIHALKHLRTMGKVGTTAENLQAAIGGENHEHTSMYPEFMQTAQSEGEKKAKEAFRRANEAEKFHEKMFAEALAGLADTADGQYFVCRECGMTFEGEAPDKCTVCGHPKDQILEVL
jgi:rubrerythrin